MLDLDLVGAIVGMMAIGINLVHLRVSYQARLLTA